MRSYLGLLIGLPAGHLLRNSIPNDDLVSFRTAGGADELKISDNTPNAIPDAVHSFMHPVVPTAHHAHKGTKAPKLPPKTISVLVLNGGNISGEAADTSYKLHQAGFATKTLPKSTPANAPSTTHNTVVYYDPSQANGQKAADELAPLFGSHTRVAPMNSAIASLAQPGGQSAHGRRDRHVVQGQAEAPAHERAARVHGRRPGAGRRLDDARGRPLQTGRGPLPPDGPAQGRRRLVALDRGGRAPFQAAATASRSSSSRSTSTAGSSTGRSRSRTGRTRRSSRSRPRSSTRRAGTTRSSRTAARFRGSPSSRATPSTGCRTRSSTACRTRR